MNEIQNKILKELNEEGISFTHVNELFNKETKMFFNKGIDFFNNFLSSPQIQERCQKINEGNPIMDKKKWYEITVYEYLKRALGLGDEGEEIIKMYLSPEITSIAEAFHGVTPRVRNILTWVHPQNPHGKEIKSQIWHRDQEDYKICKVFILFRDVTSSTGPLQYVKHTQYGGKYGDITNNMNKKSTSVFKYPIPSKEIISCEGKAGTIIFANTNGLHKGGLVKKGVRCLTQANFLNPNAPMIINKTLPTFDYSPKFNSLNIQSESFKSLNKKQKLILS
tara:strand:- start:9414 stop:10250 length:837 start_codon:yes stop_codon:yes gene_type:complete